jgi:hypothetical protein
MQITPLIPRDSPFSRSLSISWKEGIAASMMVAIADYYLIPLALFLGAVPYQIGLLVAIPHLLGSASQILAVQAVQLFRSRLKFLVFSSAAQTLFFLPLAFLPILRSANTITLMIILVSIYRILFNLIATVWGSLVSDYLEPEWRGKYMGWRLQVAGIAGLITMLSAASVLSLLKDKLTWIGFCIVFTWAACARALSFGWMRKMQDIPGTHTDASTRFSFFSFIRDIHRRNFTYFVFYASAILFAAMICSPYISVHMLQDLKFNYFTYISIHIASLVSGMIAYPLWGRHADKVGNAQVLKVTGALIPIIPVYWLLVKDPVVLFLCEMFSGFIWGGFNLCAVNFIFDAASPQSRVRHLSYFNLFNGIATFAGAAIGGFLASHLPPVWDSSFYLLCILSFLLRLASWKFLSQKFKEVRTPTHTMSSKELFFSVLGIKPALEEKQVS